MKKVILYGTPICYRCAPIKEHLEKRNVSFEYVDFTSDIYKLKEFMKIRDNSPKYDNAKKENSIGIPTMLIDDEPFIINDGSPDEVDKLIEEFGLLQ